MDSMEEFQRQNIAARLQNIRERREHESFFVELVKRKVWWQVHGNIVDNANYMQPKTLIKVSYVIMSHGSRPAKGSF